MKNLLNRIGKCMALSCMILLLCALGGCSGCGKETGAATMHLVKTAGDVAVEDAKAKSVSIIENLGLYDGYRVGTQAESYAWINLDDTKLTKMDESSNVTVCKDGRDLELIIESGNLYFNVTKPLEDDETMNIRTANMIMGIRGTEGWVELLEADHMRVYLLSGKIECSIVDDEGNVITSMMIGPGETADMFYAGENSHISLGSIQEIPEFVTRENNLKNRPEKDGVSSEDGPVDENDAPAQENVGGDSGSGTFSVAFGNITISELPVSWSVLEEDGWMIVDNDDQLVYAVKDGNYIGFRFQEGGYGDMIDWLYIANANTNNGVFDINQITLCGGVSLAGSTVDDIKGVVSVSQYDSYEVDDADDGRYYFELKNTKGFTSISLSKLNDEDFILSMSCAGNDGNQETSGNDGDSGNTGNGGTSDIVESRFYSMDEEDWQTYAVHIHENGDWTIYFEGWGAEYIEVHYSFAQEAAGEYVQVVSFDLGGDPESDGTYMPEYIGEVRFQMSESELKIKYKDSDEWRTYQRKYN